jgi:PHP domain
MHELVVNLHMHTTYSDGHISHAQIAQAALRAGIDAVIVTDHNVWVNGPEDYYQDGDRRVLLLVGEEIHDQARQPQKSHLLVMGAGRELATLAYDIPRLLESVRRAGGLSFLAHPTDPAAPAVGEDDISWDDWQVQGYTGLELWNYMSEFKSLLKSKLHALYYAFQPERIGHGPFPQTIQRWDELLTSGQRVVAVGGSDAHAFQRRLGPLRKVLFPYEFHFKCVNTHLLTPTPLQGDLESDRRMILEALGNGRSFVGYDLPGSTRGFRFIAQGLESTATMGEEVSAQKGVTLQIHLPHAAECHLIKDSKLIKTWQKRDTCTHIITEPGAYRVEVYIDYLGKKRGWIFSNPIFVK